MHIMVVTFTPKYTLIKLGMFCDAYVDQPFQSWGYICPKDKDAKIFENHLNPVMLVFIR